jgi:hypothetical protein
MKGQKNDYSMTFYNGDIRILFLEYVHNTDTAINWADKKNILWTHAMIYDRRTREKVTRIINSRNK